LDVLADVMAAGGKGSPTPRKSVGGSGAAIIRSTPAARKRHAFTRGGTPTFVVARSYLCEMLIAKQFYFELEEVPIYRGGEYTCRGSKLYRLTREPRAALLTYLYLISTSIHMADTVLIGGLKPPLQLNSTTICGINRKASYQQISDFGLSVGKEPRYSVFWNRNYVKRVRTSHLRYLENIAALLPDVFPVFIYLQMYYT
jgi:hypothetical protein